MTINKLILGDNLEIMRKMDSDSIDLIYLDPPFFSNKNYEVLWGDEGEIRSFQDRWSGGIEHYIMWLKERVMEMHRILKPTGSIYLHCDWHADAYIRVFILDKIFGENNFRNEIIWSYQGTGEPKNFFKKKHDNIYFYSKSNKYFFSDSDTKEDISDFSKTKFSKEDEKGKYKEIKHPDGSVYKQYVRENMRMRDVWEIPLINVMAKERIGYPTQKPEALLERIIKASSHEGHVILDPFVGGGTTIAVADKLNRNWIGIDQSVQAIKVTEFRLNKQQSLFSKPFTVQLHKYDYDTLRYKDAFEFETWIVGHFGGLSNSRQRGDLGLDGRTRENQPIQVKRSDNIGRNVIDNFKSACERYDKTSYEKNKSENKPLGFIIAFSFGKGAIQEVARLKVEEQVTIELITVESIVPIAKKPTLQVEMQDLGKVKELRQIEFIATGKSDAGIEFYAWDFTYKEPNFVPEILLDKTGKQTYLFKAGEHTIAVKVVDNEGLENTEIIKLKINGEVNRN